MTLKIFATVGSTYPLDRLVKELDQIGENNKYKIFAQIGESKYKPRNITWKNFLNYEEMKAKIKGSDLVISHAGAGSIIDLITSGKKFILFPRLRKYGEAVDDHQVEICTAFKKKFNINYTTNEKEILKLLIQKNKLKLKRKNKIVKEISDLL